MRVVHTITKGDVGGAQTHVAELAIAQAASGLDVSVAAGSDGPAMDRVRSAGIDVTIIGTLGRSISLRSDRAAIAELRAHYRALRPDVVHGHSSKGGLLARYAARREGLGSVYTAHGFPFQGGAPLAQRIQSFVGEFAGARFGSAVICLTEAEAALARRWRVARAADIHIVANGLPDTTELRTVGKPSVPEVVMVARFAMPKRQDQIVDVMADLTDLPWRLTFIGDGPQFDERRTHGESVLGDRVRYLGHRDDVGSLVAASDIALLWSDYEGMPIALLEAMRAGLACVASDLSGVRVLFGETGGLIAGSNDQLAAVIRRLVGDPSEIDRLGAAARTRYLAEFTVEQMVERTQSVYDSIL